MAPPDPPTVDGTVYVHALAAYIRQHEAKLADFVRRGPAPTAPSWTTILTLGVVSSDVPVARKAPLILRFDPHHLYYLLLKFDEAGIPGIGALDVLIDGGPSRPMSINYGGMSLALPGMIDSDRTSLSSFSAVSSFSLGSGWWGTSPPPPDETVDVKYLYSSCTKLPALRLSPFSFTTTPSPANPVTTLSKPVKDFQDCPPPDTAVPLYAFKNLQSLALDELDPRAFLGWDALSMQLRSLEVNKSGIEDIGELICDAVVEDAERRKKGRGGVGEERRRRQGLSQTSQDSETPPSSPPPTSTSSYPVPPAAAWSRLAHLSLSRNSLTFIPQQPLLHLSCLTSLDLSSNLLISVPPALAALHSLRFLNLSDNMIDSLHGLAKALGAIAVLNLSQNRLENLSGLDRLLALERLDLRENRLRESLEVSRLASLPVITEIYLDANPFARKIEEGGEEGWRVKCFSYFAAEGRQPDVIKIDGTGPGINERRALVQIEEGSGRRRTASEGVKGQEARVAAGEAKIVGRRVVTTPHLSRTARTSPPHSRASSPPGSPSHSLAKPTPRRRKPHRIVDLDGGRGPDSIRTAASSIAGDHSGTEASNGQSDSEETSSPQLDPVRYPVGGRRSYHDARVPSEVPEEPESPIRRHARYPTSPASSRHMPLPSPKIMEGSSSMGARPARGRERLSSSTFDPPTLHPDDPFSSGAVPVEKSADAFRKRIEALRNEVGESWLSVLGERELAIERTKRESEESGTDLGNKQKVNITTSSVGMSAGLPSVLSPTGQPAIKVVQGKKKKRGKKKATAVAVIGA
ncbi:hypothetical protein P7C70_g5241, partial [Phenoliferia sp. Uapishka_3]